MCGQDGIDSLRVWESLGAGMDMLYCVDFDFRKSSIFNIDLFSRSSLVRLMVQPA